MQLRFLHRAGGLAAVALASVLIVSSPATAAEEDLTIMHVQPEGESVQVLVSVPEQTESPADVSVTIDGEATEATVESAGDSTDIRRTTILAIDTSISMADGRIEAAQRAASTFLKSVPTDVRVGIVTFNGTITTALAPSTDRKAAQRVVDGLELGQDTHLHSALIASAKLAGSSGARNIVLLSDGKDNSQTKSAAAIKAVKRAGVRVDVVALELDEADLAPLRDLAEAGGGTVITADPESLTAAFDAEAASLSRQLLVTAPIPDSVRATEATIEVTAGSQTTNTYVKIRDKAVAAPAAPVASADSDSSSNFEVSETLMYAGLGAIGLGLLVVLGSLMWSLGKPKAGPSVQERIAAYGAGPGAAAATSGGGDPVLTLDNAKSAAAQMLNRNKGVEASISARLVAAGSALKPAEWILIHGGITIGAGLVGALLGQGDVVFILLFLFAGAVIPWLWLGRMRKKRISAFNGQLADTLTLISGSLSAGMSLQQSIDTVVQEGREPIAGEFKQALVQSRLGVPLVDALEDVAVRTESKDFAWVVMAIRIQRQVGGNLTELLSTVAATLRERDYLRRQVQTLSAEGRLSGWILGGLPVAMFVYMLLVRREYVSRLWTEAMGLVMLGGAVVLLAFGAFVISRLVKVEV
ncbi:tight adherence protein B [Nocardioides daedukensis]|uniref:Tight adherence protein B n=1 Tax=Nocardioides daedukensis TaxID=634462 RepID=A0A7Y9RXF0_9ACTN|nr:type II secretion system F family protein [Nocardioides daedukensis]NYG58030.1 tight adherence protein B [Nocardioides daedukensis]